MALYNISYDLKAHKDYARVINGIQRLTKWSRPLESVWLVESHLSAVGLRDAVGAYMDSDDKLLVTGVVPGAMAWRNIAPAVADWMRAA
jgi:hypothetical protein